MNFGHEGAKPPSVHAGAARRFLLAGQLIGALLLGGMAWGQARPVAVGLVFDAPSEQNAAMLHLFKEQMQSAVPAATELQFPAEKTLNGDGASTGVAAALDALLADAGVGIVVMLGPLGAGEAARRSTLSKPVVAPFIYDADLQGFPRQGDASGAPNLSYTTNLPQLTRDLQTLKELCSVERVAVLADAQVLGDPARVQAYATKAATDAGLQAQCVFIEPTAEAALAALPADAQAVYLGPLPRTAPAELDKLIAGVNERKLPTFSMRGREDVTRGVLVGFASDPDLKALAYRSAQNVQRILQGEAAAALPVLLPAEENLTLNTATARLLNLTPAPEVAVEAELLNVPSPQVTAVGLAEAVDSALSASPELKEAQNQLDEAAQDVRDAKAGLLPQAELGTKPAPRDPERALMGLPQDLKVAGSAGLSQVVYSEKARTDVSVRQKRLERQEYDRQELLLDTALDTAKAYLDVLEAEAFLKIQQRELRLVRGYLELGRLRQARGVAGAEEVYRWESAQSSMRKGTLDAEEKVRSAKLALNRLLRRPQEQEIEVSGGFGDETLLGAYRRILSYLQAPESFESLSKYLVQEGVKNAPELAKLDAELSAQERVAVAARREYYTPTVTLNGEVSQVLGEDRRRRDEDNSLKLPVSLVPGAKEADWGVGIHASLPLYGGGRRAARGKVNADLERLRLERTETKEKLEQQIRSALLKLRASHAGVPQAQQATAAAGKSLEEVALAYEHGQSNIAALLDAQNAAYIAQQAEIHAQHEFLSDLLRVQRVAGRFDFLMAEHERETWFDRLDSFVHAASPAPAKVE
jgi:outer membrane protein TolC/ABC-type uncharacterized transport system substrate-binding protein